MTLGVKEEAVPAGMTAEAGEEAVGVEEVVEAEVAEAVEAEVVEVTVEAVEAMMIWGPHLRDDQDPPDAVVGDARM